MTIKILTPHEFNKLNSTNEIKKAYARLYKAWHKKGERKSIVVDQRNSYRNVFSSGANGRNAQFTAVSNKIIEKFWEMKHQGLRTSTNVLHDYQLDIFGIGALKKGTVRNWNTSLNNVWDQREWINTNSDREKFEKMVRDLRSS